MLSESVHSLGDSLNQVLLAIGIRVRVSLLPTSTLTPLPA
jgi:divalent metal cation (Fe/Co/Zn/Cd) transporter